MSLRMLPREASEDFGGWGQWQWMGKVRWGREIRGSPGPPLFHSEPLQSQR